MPEYYVTPDYWIAGYAEGEGAVTYPISKKKPHHKPPICKAR